MPRVARGKKTAENNKVSAEKVDNNEMTPKDQDVPEKISAQDDKIEESVLNGNVEAKTTVKATKSSKGKKESKNVTEELEPKIKGTSKKVASKEMTSNDDEIDEKETPQVPEIKKRATKKKNDDIPKEIPAAKKRNKAETTDNGKNGEEKIELIKSAENNKKEAPKKRGTKEQPKVDASEPAKKRSKKAEEIPVVPEEKKKIVRGRKAVEGPIVVNTEPEKPPAKKQRGKAAVSKVDDEKVVDEPKVDDLVVEKAATKQTKGKSVKKAVSKGKDNLDEIVVEPKQTSKKAKITKKDSKDEDNLDEIVEEPKPISKKAIITKKSSKDEENLDEVVEEPKLTSRRAKNAANKAEKPAPEKKFQNSIESDLSIDFNIKEKWNLKIVTWNISGLRSCVDKGCVDYFKQESPDVICLNVSSLILHARNLIIFMTHYFFIGNKMRHRERNS